MRIRQAVRRAGITISAASRTSFADARPAASIYAPSFVFSVLI
jgi:hypothetical protein